MIYAQFLKIWRGGENCKMEELDSLEWRHIKPLLVRQFSFLVFSGNRVYLLFTHRTFRFLNPCQEKIRKENAVKYAILYTELDDHWSSSEGAKISIYFTSIIGHQQLRLNWTGGIVDRVQIDILELSTDQWPCQSTTWPICYSLLIWETRAQRTMILRRADLSMSKHHMTYSPTWPPAWNLQANVMEM